MRILILGLVVVMCGCVSVEYKDLKPQSVYTLEDGSKIRVYRTMSETMYIKGDSFSTIRSE
jgi:hypothetical protein